MSAGAAGVLGRGVRTVSGLTFLSRLLGLSRDLMTARMFGDTAVGSAFAAAIVIPNLFRRLFGEGALSAAFLPAYSRLRDEDGARADAFGTLVVLSVAAVTTGLCVLIEAGLLAAVLLAPGEGARGLSLRLLMLTLPYMPLICTAAIVGGVLQAGGRFGPWAASPMVLNVCMLGAGLPFFFLDGPSSERWAVVLGASVVVSGALQLAWCVASLRGLMGWTVSRERLSAVRGEAGEMLRRLGPVFVGLGTLQVNALLDTVIAMWPTWFGPTVLGVTHPLDEASNAVLSYAQRLYQFPLGVFGIAVATVVFPELSRRAGDAAAFGETLRRGMRLSLFIGVPASAGLALVAGDMVATLYGGGGSGGDSGDGAGGGAAGAFSAEGLARTAAVLLAYAGAVWAYSLNHVLARALYARGDTTSPVRAGLAAMGVNLALNLTLIWWMREAGLAAATAAAAVVQTALLARTLRRQGTTLLDAGVVRGVVRTLAATAAMALAVLLVPVVLRAAAPGLSGWAAAAWRLGLATGVGGAAYAAAARALGAEELRWLAGRAAGARGA